jgi:hypothetical protein
MGVSYDHRTLEVCRILVRWTWSAFFTDAGIPPLVSEPMEFPVGAHLHRAQGIMMLIKLLRRVMVANLDPVIDHLLATVISAREPKISLHR